MNYRQDASLVSPKYNGVISASLFSIRTPKSVHDQSISELYVHNLLLRPYQMHKPMCLVSIAPGTVLSSSQLVHLGNALLEFFILALLVAVSLILE